LVPNFHVGRRLIRARRAVIRVYDAAGNLIETRAQGPSLYRKPGNFTRISPLRYPAPLSVFYESRAAKFGDPRFTFPFPLTASPLHLSISPRSCGCHDRGFCRSLGL